MKPQPQPKDIICSECGLAWDLHKETDAKKGVELSECIRLLKAELARRPKWSHGITYGTPQATWTIGSAS